MLQSKKMGEIGAMCVFQAFGTKLATLKENAPMWARLPDTM
jgi:hypothetical protein